MDSFKQEINNAYQLYQLQQVKLKSVYEILEDYHFAKLITDEQYSTWMSMGEQECEKDFAQWLFGSDDIDREAVERFEKLVMYVNN